MLTGRPLNLQNIAPSEGTKDWLKKLTAKYGTTNRLTRRGFNLIQTDSDVDLSMSKVLFLLGEAYVSMGKSRILKESYYARYISTKQTGMTEQDVVVV
jgi:hypothetical protein